MGALVCASLAAGCFADSFQDKINQTVGITDPLSMPRSPTVDASLLSSAKACGQCHPNHYEEWSESRHAHAMTDVVFRALVGELQAEHNGTLDRYCVQCHSAIGIRSGDVVGGFQFEELDSLTLEGATCEGCHRVSEIVRPFNSGHLIDENGPIRGPNERMGRFHAVEENPAFRQSMFCGGCHDVFTPDMVQLESPYAEWENSPSAEAGQTCQECHMPTYEGRVATLDDLPIRNDLHLHKFLGIDDIATTDAPQSSVDRVLAFLRTSADLEINVEETIISPGASFVSNYTVTNLIQGHNLPTGSTFFRQLWLHIQVADADGTVLYETGETDENGDLRDGFGTSEEADPDLMIFNSELKDADGQRTLRPWRTVTHEPNNTLAPGESRTLNVTINVPENVQSPLTIRAEVLFRSFPPHLLRDLGLNEYASKLRSAVLIEKEATITITQL